VSKDSKYSCEEFLSRILYENKDPMVVLKSSDLDLSDYSDGFKLKDMKFLNQAFKDLLMSQAGSFREALNKEIFKEEEYVQCPVENQQVLLYNNLR